MGKRYVAWVVGIACLLLLTGCGSLRVRQPLLGAEEIRLPVMGMTGIRDWGDVYSPLLQKSLVEAAHDYEQWRIEHKQPLTADVYILALSGGGADGAFGAGVLYGWAKTGTRPEFRVVTGVSTGALSAPFVFLGEKYDDKLRQLYTNLTTKDIFFIKNLFSIFRGDSVADTKPLKKLVEKSITPEMMAEIAREHRRGRRLFIATTNLDAQRNVVWDIGAIAASGNPNALKLIHRVLIASASIPVAFPPVYIPVEKDGKRYDEMHVDGGVISQFIVYDAYLRPKEFAKTPQGQKYYASIHKHVYVIVNNKLGPVGEAVRPRLVPIASRSISTLIKSQAKGSLAYSYLLTKRDGMSLEYIVIPEDFDIKTNEAFDKKAMRETFEMGFKLGEEGKGWERLPPGYIQE